MKITVDMNKAKEIKKDMVRVERAPLLAALDVQVLRAIEDGDSEKQALLVAKKQALRDATSDPLILNAVTPEELKTAIPSAFKNL